MARRTITQRRCCSFSEILKLLAFLRWMGKMPDNLIPIGVTAFSISSPFRIVRGRIVASATHDDSPTVGNNDFPLQQKRLHTIPTYTETVPSGATIAKSHNQMQTAKRTQTRVKSLNNDIFRLRTKKNGIELAEQRLNGAIQEMLDNTDRVHQLLASMKSTQDLSIYPDEVTFNAILSSHAKNAKQDPMAAAKAEQLLQRMHDLANVFPHLQPSIFSYNAVMEAYTKTCNSSNPKRAQQSKLAILRIFRKLYREIKLQPNTFTNNLLLTSNTRSSRERQNLEQWALEYLDCPTSTSVLPDRNTYNQLFQSYASSGDADKAEILLQKIITFITTVSIPNTDLKVSPVWFNLVLKALASSRCMEIHETSLGSRADNLLRQMYDLYRSGHNDHLHPQTSTYNHVLNVHTMLGDTERAENLVEELEQRFVTNSIEGLDLRPDRITFTTLIKAYAIKLKDLSSNLTQQAHDIAINATHVYERMESLGNAGWEDIAPNCITCKPTRSAHSLL